MNNVKYLLNIGFFSILFSLTQIIGLNLALASTSDAIEGNIDDVARAIHTYFPKVSGKIVAIGEKTVEVDLGLERGLTEGILLTVFREREQFLHPVTGVPLGRFEDVLGSIEVIGFEQPYLSASLVEPIGAIQIGDLVRISATRIPLAVSLSSDRGHSFLMNELVSAMIATGRFKIETLSPGARSEDALKGANRYHIILDTSRDETQFTMNLEIQNTLTGTQLAKLRVLINLSEESDLILEHLQFQLFEQRQKK